MMEVRVCRVFRLLPLVLLLIPACAKKRDPGVPVRPFVDVADDRVCIGTVAGDPRGGIVRYVFALDGTPADSTAFLASGETAWSRIAIPDSGSLRVRALCRNSFGLSSDWSEELVYQLSAPPARRDTDVYWSPWDTTWFVRPWGRERWYRVGFNVTDPDGDSVAVKFLWDDGRSSGWSAFMPSGSDVIDSVMYVTDGDHYVRVLVKDRGGTIIGPDTIACLRVSEIALLWFTQGVGCDVSPTLGTSPELRCFSSDEEQIYCLDRSGAVVWEAGGFDCTDMPSALSRDNSRLYCFAYGSLTSIDTRTGVPRWSYPLWGGDGPDVVPAIGPSDEIYVPGPGGMCRVRDRGDSATVEWTSGPVFELPAGISISRDTTIYVTGRMLSRRSAIAAYRQDGTLRWCDSTLWRTEYSSPIVDGLGRVLVSECDLYPHLRCVNPDGSLAWTTDVVFGWAPGVVGGQNETYWSLAGTLLCLSPDGSTAWIADIDAGGEESPCIASDGSVMLWSDDYVLSCISRFGEPLWTYSVEDTLDRYFDYELRRRDDGGDLFASPTIGPDGNIYHDDGDAIICIAIGRRTLGRTPWPAAYHDPARSGWAGRMW
jgi:hypothetical protein